VGSRQSILTPSGTQHSAGFRTTKRGKKSEEGKEEEKTASRGEKVTNFSGKKMYWTLWQVAKTGGMVGFVGYNVATRKVWRGTNFLYRSTKWKKNITKRLCGDKHLLSGPIWASKFRQRRKKATVEKRQYLFLQRSLQKEGAGVVERGSTIDQNWDRRKNGEQHHQRREE